jgi:hypothetical protein
MYEEKELENYSKYMDFINELIMEKYLDYVSDKRDIDIIKIFKTKNKSIWRFNFEIQNREFCSDFISYKEWFRLQKTDTRDILLSNILNGLEPKHKEILIEGLKNSNNINE